MALLTAKELLERGKKLKFEDVAIPEWGGSVRLRSMTATEHDAWEASLYQTQGKDIKYNRANLRARLVAMCAVNEDGSKMFTTEQAAELGLCECQPMDRLFEKASRLCGLGVSDIKELEKNSESGQAGDSSSASPQS